MYISFSLCMCVLPLKYNFIYFYYWLFMLHSGYIFLRSWCTYITYLDSFFTSILGYSPTYKKAVSIFLFIFFHSQSPLPHPSKGDLPTSSYLSSILFTCADLKRDDQCDAPLAHCVHPIVISELTSFPGLKLNSWDSTSVILFGPVKKNNIMQTHCRDFGVIFSTIC